MASWVTHLMIADSVMKQCPELDRHGFCVGNIAPDCNVVVLTMQAIVAFFICTQ